MNPRRRYEDRTSVAVVARIGQPLKIKSSKNSSPDMGVVVDLANGLAPVVQVSISQQESSTAQFQVELVVGLDGVRHQHRSQPVRFSPPSISRIIGAYCDRLVHLRIRVRFVLTLVPAKAGKGAHRTGYGLFHVC